MIRAIVVALLTLLMTPSLLLCRVQDLSSQDPRPAQGAAEPQPAAVAEAPATSAAGSGPPAQEAAKEIQDSDKPRRAAARQPPDGEWLVDAEGRSYFIEKRPKSRPYLRSGDARVRLDFGIDHDLAGEDEETLWIKVYRPADKPVARRSMSRDPTAAELAASAATFLAPALRVVDRLLLRAFDAGLPKQGMWRNGFDLADVNGDGEVDFVHGPTRRGGDQPRVFLGDGHGTWRSYRATVPPGLLDYGDIKVADFNRDGKADLATASHFRGLLVFIGDGAGRFSPWSEGLDYDAPKPGYDASGFSSRRIEVLDWNKDGKPDLLALSEGPRMALMKTGNVTKVAAGGKGPEVFGPRIFLNRGDGTWAAVAESGTPMEIFGDDLAVADFDVDGSPDFLISTNKMGRTDLLYLGRRRRRLVCCRASPAGPRLCGRRGGLPTSIAIGGPTSLVGSVHRTERQLWRISLDLYLNGRDGSPGSWRPVFVKGRTGHSKRWIAVADFEKDRRPGRRGARPARVISFSSCADGEGGAGSGPRRSRGAAQAGQVVRDRGRRPRSGPTSTTTRGTSAMFVATSTPAEPDALYAAGPAVRTDRRRPAMDCGVRLLTRTPMSD